MVEEEIDFLIGVEDEPEAYPDLAGRRSQSALPPIRPKSSSCRTAWSTSPCANWMPAWSSTTPSPPSTARPPDAVPRIAPQPVQAGERGAFAARRRLL